MSDDKQARPSKSDWQREYDATRLRDVPFETMSGVPVDPVYGDAPLPGQYPFTRGLHAAGYRSRLWTMRMFAGFGTAEDTNARFKEILRNGGMGLSTAFDMPTLMGYDSDSPWALGEVGRAGVAIDTLRDMEDLYADIDLGTVSTSMTINGPAAALLAMYIAVGEQGGVAKADLAGTIQNDILKEYQAQKEYIYPRAEHADRDRHDPLHLGRDAEVAPRLDLRVPHPRSRLDRCAGTGVHPRQRIRLRRSRPRRRTGRQPVRATPLVLLQRPLRLLRGDRQVPCRSPHLGPVDEERYGATDERAMMCRFHTQTAGVSLTAQQPENNIARVAIQALSAALGGTQSLHTDSFDEALALPTEKAARIALRTQQVVAHETGVTNVADPLGGAPYVEWMTDEMERQAEAVFAHLDELGNGSILEGVYAGIDNGYFVGEIADAAYRFEREINNDQRIIVGVNEFTDGNEDDETNLLRIDHSVEELQRKRLEAVKQERDSAAVEASLAAIRTAAADPTVNLMPPIIGAVKTYATEEEISNAMRDVFGTYVEQAIV